MPHTDLRPVCEQRTEPARLDKIRNDRVIEVKILQALGNKYSCLLAIDTLETDFGGKTVLTGGGTCEDEYLLSNWLHWS